MAGSLWEAMVGDVVSRQIQSEPLGRGAILMIPIMHWVPVSCMRPSI